MRQNFGWALSNFSSAWFSEEKHFPVLLLYINELTSDVTKHPNNWAVSDLQYINKWWCLWKILQIFFQVYAKPNKEKKEKRKRNLKEVFKVFNAGPRTYKPNAGRLLCVERLLQAICVLGARERAYVLRMSPLAAWTSSPEFIYSLWMFFEQ